MTLQKTVSIHQLQLSLFHMFSILFSNQGLNKKTLKKKTSEVWSTELPLAGTHHLTTTSLKTTTEKVDKSMLSKQERQRARQSLEPPRKLGKPFKNLEKNMENPTTKLEKNRRTSEHPHRKRRRKPTHQGAPAGPGRAHVALRRAHLGGARQGAQGLAICHGGASVLVFVALGR